MPRDSSNLKESHLDDEDLGFGHLVEADNPYLRHRLNGADTDPGTATLEEGRKTQRSGSACSASSNTRT